MTRLKDVNISNHLIKRMNMREQLIKKLDIIPIEVVVRNIATGSLVQRLGIKEGKVLNRPIIEFYLKNDKLTNEIKKSICLLESIGYHSTRTPYFKPQELPSSRMNKRLVHKYLLPKESAPKSFWVPIL